MFFMEAATIKQQESTEQRHIRIKAINSEDFKKQITCHILGCHSVTRLLIKDEFVFTVFVVCSSEYETGTIAWIGCSGWIQVGTSRLLRIVRRTRNRVCVILYMKKQHCCNSATCSYNNNRTPQIMLYNSKTCHPVGQLRVAQLPVAHAVDYRPGDRRPIAT